MPARSRLKPYQLLLIIWFADMVLAGLACVVSRQAAMGPSSWHAGDSLVVTATALVTWIAFALHGTHEAETSVTLVVAPKRFVIGWMIAFALLMLLLFGAATLRNLVPGNGATDLLVPHGTAPAWMLCLFGSGLAFLIAGRPLLLALLARLAPADVDSFGVAALRAVVVGVGPHAARIRADLESGRSPNLRVIGVVDEYGRLAEAGAASRSRDEMDFRIRALGAASILDLLRHGSIDAVILALPGESRLRTLALSKCLEHLPVDIWLAPDTAPEPGLDPSAAALPLLQLRGRPLGNFQLAVKKIEDMVIGSALLIMAAPLMVLIAAAIRLESRGPVIFTQVRRGYNERLIGVLKFRTMHVYQTDDDAVQQTVRGDARVTRVGRVLRRLSLDELPQLINVLRGEMSVVGPRPHALQTKAAGMLFDEVVGNYGSRHRVKPGITGWAQVNGWRGETDTIEKIVRRVEFDLDYIDNWSLKRDLAIVAMTVFKMFTDREAY